VKRAALLSHRGGDTRPACLDFRTASRKLEQPSAVAPGVTRASVLLLAGCFVASPPALSQWPARRPTIVHDSVVPSSDQILKQLPVDSTLLVPVEIDNPNESVEYELFIDYQASDATSLVAKGQSLPTTSPGGGATLVIGFSLATNVARARLSTPYCHRIEAMVAHRFSAVHAPDIVGGDSVTWLYNGTGNAQACPAADAGPLDGGDGGVVAP
jgi:hypothetical protein